MFGGEVSLKRRVWPWGKWSEMVMLRMWFRGNNRTAPWEEVEAVALEVDAPDVDEAEVGGDPGSCPAVRGKSEI